MFLTNKVNSEWNLTCFAAKNFELVGTFCWVGGCDLIWVVDWTVDVTGAVTSVVIAVVVGGFMTVVDTMGVSKGTAGTVVDTIVDAGGGTLGSMSTNDTDFGTRTFLF